MNAAQQTFPCFVCKERKPREDFFADSSRKTGLASRCKPCDSKLKESKRQRTGYYRSENYRKRVRRSGRGKYARRKTYLVRYASKHPERIAARNAIRRAIKSGQLKKLSCFCGEKQVEAHHHKGYEKNYWLDVQWLCREHHRLAD